MLGLGQQAAWSFSLGGPINNGGDDWQSTVIGYGLPGDIVAPKNLGEEYRRNAQVYYYAYDANFLDFFGSNGVVAADQAFAIMNNALTNVDSFSAGLTEFPLNSQAFNYQASSLGLLDLKSETLGTLVEQMSLADPVRYAWTLHDRYPVPNSPQCTFIYLVVQRNLDVISSPLNQIQYSPYINGTLYSYFISEACPASVPDPQALAVPVQVDPLQNSFTAVAGMNGSAVYFEGIPINAGLQLGGFYTGLTRDDAAGLRYLLTTNNINYESPTTGALLQSSTQTGGTNYGPPFVLYTSNYNAFAEAALTNDPVTLSNLYPGLIILSSTPSWVVETTPIIVLTTNSVIGAPAGTTVIGIKTNGYTQTVVAHYSNTYGNLVVPKPYSSTNSSSTGLLVTVQSSPVIGAPAGYFYSQTNFYFVTVHQPAGDYYIETNICGPSLILSNLLTITTPITNLLYSITNSAGQFFYEYVVTYAKTHALIAQPVLCGAAAGGGTSNSPALYQGVNHIQFVKTSYDSLVGQYYQPITNYYSMKAIVNSKLVDQTFERIITTPDFLLTAADLAGGPADLPVTPALGRGINFNSTYAPADLAGPGTIDPVTAITYDKVGSIYENDFGGNQATAILRLQWASFDGSTNDPVLYPNGTSIDNLANQVLVQVSPTTLSAGSKNVTYPATTFVATGGAFSPPFTWSISSGGLPSGMMLSAGGTISGTPTQSGTFDFTVQLTDSLARTVTWNYTLIVN